MYVCILVGVSSTLWLVLWCVYVTDTPVKHKRITTAEKEYILHSLKGQVSYESSKKVCVLCVVSLIH